MLLEKALLQPIESCLRDGGGGSACPSAKDQAPFPVIQACLAKAEVQMEAQPIEKLSILDPQVDIGSDSFAGQSEVDASRARFPVKGLVPKVSKLSGPAHWISP